MDSGHASRKGPRTEKAKLAAEHDMMHSDEKTMENASQIQDHLQQNNAENDTSAADDTNAVVDQENHVVLQRQCCICETEIESDAPQFEFCEGGCEICQECSFNESVREVLTTEDAMQCIICEQAPILPGRTEETLFDRYARLVFHAEALQESASLASSPSRTTSGREKRKRRQSKPGVPKGGKSSNSVTEKSSVDKNSGHSTESAVLKSGTNASELSTEDACTGKEAGVLSPVDVSLAFANETGLALATEDASGDERKYTFSFSGGVLDVRYHDVETVFAQHPIVSNIEIHEYRRVKAHSLIKMLRVVNGEAPAPKRRPRGGAVAQPAVRKIPMRLIIPELNEILGQWVRKSKELGKAIELAEFVQKFASDQYGVKTMADDHLVNLVASIQALEGQSDRIAFFGMVLGLTKPEMYTPLLSEVLFTVISLLFESSREWCECLDTGDGASWVPQERVEVMAEKLFDVKSRAWLLEVAHADCTRLKTPMPWNTSARSSFDNQLAGLAVEPSAMGISRAKARHVTVVSGLDAVLKFVLSAWLMEWARTLSHLERVEAEFRAAEQREIQIRADIRSSASERPFTLHEKEILWDLAGEVLAEGGHKTMPRNAAHQDWQTLQSRNSQRREKDLHFLRNRRPEDLCAAYQEILKEHHHKEARRWDFNRWDWDEDWEWGGLTLACDGPEQPQTPELLRRQETQRQHLSPTLQASATMPSLRDHEASKYMHLKHSHSSSTSAFNFGYFAVGSRHASTVTEALWKHQQPVANLCLRDNQFNDEACTMIVAAIAKQHQVATFDLSCNLAGSMTATMLAKQAEVALATHLTSLHLANNRLDNAAMADLLKALACHRALRELNIAGNGLGSSSILARALATLVCTNRKGAANIATLDLSWNKLLSSDVVPLLKELATNNRCLCVLKLDLNLVDESAMEALAACMKSNSFLQSVSLAHNKLRMPLGTEATDARVHIISSGEHNQDADIMHL